VEQTADGQHDSIRPIAWRDGSLVLLDQRLLPARMEYLVLDRAADVAAAITDMVVRGAPAIGISAAFGVALAARAAWAADPENWRQAIEPDMQRLAGARPTAVNLFWALQRMRGLFAGIEGDPEPPLVQAAQAMLEADIADNKRMGTAGAELIGADSAVLTHCNAGALATGGYGTALGVVRAGFSTGRVRHVYAGETRPWLQGARLTAWELVEEGIPATLITDSAAASFMQRGLLDWVIVGSDRIAANGDVANKIGTYALAVLARHHGVRFMVVAPTSTIDRAAPDGASIPIEQRSPAEVHSFAGRRVAAAGVGAENPAFDVTPAALVDVLVTEKGVVEHPDAAGIAALFGE